MKETAVVINTYNQGEYIKDAINSVVNQTYKDWDIIFFNNNSEDNTYYEYAKMAVKNKVFRDHLFKYLNTRTHYDIDRVLPIGIARWIAVQKAIQLGYKYIAILDGDDFWYPEKLEKQIALFKKDEEVKMVFSDCYYLHWNEERTKIEEYPVWMIEKKFDKVLPKTFHQKYKPKMKDPFWSLLTKYNFIPCLTMMFEAEALSKVIGNPMHYTAAEDYDWILKMTSKFKCDYVPEPLAYYRIHADQISQKTKARCTAEEIDVVKRAVEFRKLTQHQGMRVWIHLLWLYIKLLLKELAEAEVKIREME